MDNPKDKKNIKKRSFVAEFAAVSAVLEISRANAKADFILSKYRENLGSFERARAEAIVMSWLRNRIMIGETLKALCAKKTDGKILSLLNAAAADALSSSPEKFPKITDCWVSASKQKFSNFEARFVNAVLRKIPETAKEILSKKSGLDALSFKYSHPLWLIKKWAKFFGEEKTEEILRANSKPSAVYFRRDYSEQSQKLAEEFSDCLKPLKDGIFFSLKKGMWNKARALLESPHFYIQDPSTFAAPSQFEPQAGKKYLDLCASPGGKTKAISDIMGMFAPNENSLIVSVDLPERIDTLRENVSKIKNVKAHVVECDILNQDLAEILREKNLPAEFDGVFIDAPCSNTGVLGRRPDARYRLSPQDIFSCAKKQLEILSKAKAFVSRGGKLEFSTCSIEPEENEENISLFLKENPEFYLEKKSLLLPCDEHDGASCFLLKRND